MAGAAEILDDDAGALMCACATVRRASRSITQLYDSWLRRHGIEAPQFALLAALNQLGEANQVALARRFDLDKTTLSRNLKVLSQKGWISVAGGSDARERIVRLTPAGRRKVAAAHDSWQQAQGQLRSALTDEEWAAMWKTFGALTRAARAAERGDRR
jgi:DNA-binding MarR family transcriptional regulator